jgi:hypothetical protein
MPVEPQGQQEARRTIFINGPTSPEKYLLIKANPPKGGDAKLRD